MKIKQINKKYYIWRTRTSGVRLQVHLLYTLIPYKREK